MKWLLGLATGGWGWALAAGKWLLEHWKLVAVVLLVLVIFVCGMRYERSGWEKRWGARDAEEALIESERVRTIAELDAAIDAVEGKAQAEKAARSITYAKIDEEVARYVLLHSQPAVEPGAGRCPAAGLGPDGLRLVGLTIAARRAGAGEGDAAGPDGVRVPRSSEE